MPFVVAILDIFILNNIENIVCPSFNLENITLCGRENKVEVHFKLNTQYKISTMYLFTGENSAR